MDSVTTPCPRPFGPRATAIRRLAFGSAIAASLVLPSHARACATHGLMGPPVLASEYEGSDLNDGMVTGTLIIETLLVPPSSTTTCAAGVGVGSFDDLAPADLAITDMKIVVFNRVTGSRVPLPEFGFLPNAITTDGLADGSGPGGPTGTNPLFEGSTWFGFSAIVEPFTPPVLGPDESFAFQFTVQLPLALVPVMLQAQYAGGAGESDGYPTFDGAHPVQYFAPPDPWVTFTAPSSVLVDIDIKPGSQTNCVNESANGVIPVAILGNGDFEVTDVDVTSLSFAGLEVRLRGDGEPSCSLDDVNADGWVDLVCRFAYSPERWMPGEGEATLRGELFGGTEIHGTDSICIVPGK